MFSERLGSFHLYVISGKSQYWIFKVSQKKVFAEKIENLSFQDEITPSMWDKRGHSQKKK